MFLAAVCALFTAAANAEPPAIARPRLAGNPPAEVRGVVFFLESKIAPGIVAVGTAHTLTPEALARAQRVELALPGTRAPVAVSERFAVAPGRPFSDADAALRDDYAVFVLAARPRGVRALAADAGPLASGARVHVLGPGTGKSPEQDVAGTITSATAERIEVQLDAAVALEGWGGAPVLAEGRVIGILQAAFRAGRAARDRGADRGVLDALREPLDGGKGRRFAAFAPARAPRDAGREAGQAGADAAQAADPADRGQGHALDCRSSTRATARRSRAPCAARSSRGARARRTARRAAST
jgi:hypothetical protein